MNRRNTRVIVYVNSSHEDHRYLNEAVESAKSFKRCYPDVDFLLYTDAPDFASGAFDAVLPASFDIPDALSAMVHRNGQLAAKLSVLPEVEYDKVMYLGSDTYALKEAAGSLFDLLDRFDLAAAHAPHRISTTHTDAAVSEIPACFPEFNCDLILFRRSRPVLDFLEKWRDMYLGHALGHPHDQGAFRYLAWTSDLRIATLPPEYNYRGGVYQENTVILQNRKRLHEYLVPTVKAELPVSRRHRIRRSLSRIIGR